MKLLLENWREFVNEGDKRTGILNSNHTGEVYTQGLYSSNMEKAAAGVEGQEVEIVSGWQDQGVEWKLINVDGIEGWVEADAVDEGSITKEAADPCWKGYKKQGMKKKAGRMVPNCVPLEEEVIEEKDDACTRKVKSRYKVWPSAYASGALVKCRKVGAANWGNKSKKESVEHLEEKSDFSKEEKEGLHGWFSRQGAKGKVGGWIDCNTGKPCGRQKGEKRAKPRCRPTKAQCKGYKRPDERNENMRMSKNLLEGIIFEEVRRFIFETNVLPHLDEAFLEDGTPVCVGCLAEQLDAASCDCPDLVYEAEYQGRKVTLNKPTRGDVKKFKVYVKDPSTGNIKKVNFGHGGSSAKAKGEKTMKIRKSNPKARKNFRARHNCDNPGPKTKARYWSCKKW